MKKKSYSPVKRIGRGFPVWGQMIVRIPFLLFWIWDRIRPWIFRQKPLYTLPCRTLSIVIPTRNEESYIEKCIESISKSLLVSEIIVVDAGSSDNTIRLAMQCGARVLLHDRPIECGGGRGGQIQAGIKAAIGDVVGVVHADTLLPETEVERLMNVLNRCPDIIGGAVGNRFDGDPKRFRWIELANHFRAAFFKISFGDQVQFFRRVPVVSRNLFPDIPIMEDVEFSIRLHRLGRQSYLFGNALASSRRWDRIGYRNAGWVIINVSLYLIGRIFKRLDLIQVYRKYYASWDDH